MAGTKEGGMKAAAKNLAKNPNFYADIGRKGGRNGHSGGFATEVPCSCEVFMFDHFVKNCAGAKGGVKSRRTKKVIEVIDPDTGTVTKFKEV